MGKNTRNIESEGNKAKNDVDYIRLECDGWRSWERLGDEVLDWEGVVFRYGGASEELDSKINTLFFIRLNVSRSHSKRIFERIKSYRGVIRAEWTRHAGNVIYMGTFGDWSRGKK